MSKESKITIVALLIALVPFLGFPAAWKTFFIVVSALSIAGLSFAQAVKNRLENTVSAEAKNGLPSSSSNQQGSPIRGPERSPMAAERQTSGGQEGRAL